MPHRNHHRRSKKNRRNRSSSAEVSSKPPKKVRPEDLTRWLFPKVPVSSAPTQGFQKGNKVGRQFKKGQTINPRGGQGQKAGNSHLVSNELQKLLGEALPGDTNQRTLAQAIAQVIASKALLGFSDFIKIFIDRTEGRVPITIDVGNTADPLMDLLTEMRRKHEELGPPERSESEEAGAKHRSREEKKKG